jgi:2-polyprenyl-6-methoxyphenol hydroxylase-like FAD-dependent oxidoreductase
MDTQVLIVGAGPTGLMLANQLARRGVKPIIIDHHSGPAQQTRAMGVQARTMEIYAKMGIIDQALAQGARTVAANVWANGRWTARVPLGDIGQSLSPFPFVLMLGQDDNEHIMGDKLRDCGVEIEWNSELIALEQQPDCVNATLKLPDGTTRAIKAAWVAGCDGSHSPVREMCGIKFPGAPYQHTFFVADTEVTGSMRPGELNVYLWRDGFHLFFPMRGKDTWRVIGILPKQLRPRDDVRFEEVEPAIKQEAGADLNFKACHWFSTYRIYHRAAEHFRDRRCFLLGDAAHIHSPAGAQGMNTGLQDAYNLAWKLALVVQGRADVALLDTYEQERIPVAKRLLETTDRAFQFIVADGWWGRLLRTRILANVAARAMTFERVRQLAFRTISQLGISYPGSSMSRALPGLPKDAAAAGERFPWMRLKLEPNGPVEDLFAHLDDTTFNLLVIGQPVNPQTLGDFGDLLRIHPIAADAANAAELTRVKVPQPSFYLLRPDGHVGLCGARLEVADVKRYLAEQVHLRTQGARSNGDQPAGAPSSGAAVTPIRKPKSAA